MGALGEIVRGGSASAIWILGLPFVNLRTALTARDHLAARRSMAAHSTRFLEICRIKVDVSGTPPEAGSGCVVCYNESSFPDVAAFTAVMWPHLDRAAAADLYGFVPFARAAARKAAVELVPRGNRLRTDQLIERMVQAVTSGERLAWGGEGRLSGQDGVARFKIGASLIAIRSQAPIIPLAIYGGNRTMALGSLRARPGTIQFRFGAPVSTTGRDETDARDLADHVQAVVAGMYEDLRKQDAVPS
jgi:1-acyl-sn-glycerol-3-phosphate acyltransferase